MHDDEVKPEMAEAYQRNLNKFREAMRKEFPEPLIVIGVDYGTGPSTATIHHKCARCDALLPVALCGLSEAAAQANIDAALAAHRERCFVVGDRVKADLGWGSEYWGDVESVSAATASIRVTSVSEKWFAYEPCPFPGQRRHESLTFLRVTDPAKRIPRPEQKVEEPLKLTSHRCQGIAHGKQCPERTTEQHEIGTWRCAAHSRPALTVVPIAHNPTPHATDAEIKALLEAQGGLVGWSEERPTLSASLGHLKHGPGGSGLSGPCDADCRKCAVERQPPTIETPWMKVDAPHNPIDTIESTKYDGLTGKECLERFQAMQRDKPIGWRIRWRSTSGETGLGMSFPTFDACDHAVRSFNDRVDRPRDLTHSVERDALAPVQLAAARELWSLHLKAKISASKQSEANRVRCEIQDVEDGEPWR